MTKDKSDRDYITHMPVDFGNISNRDIINEGKKLIMNRYRKRNSLFLKED